MTTIADNGIIYNWIIDRAVDTAVTLAADYVHGKVNVDNQVTIDHDNAESQLILTGTLPNSQKYVVCKTDNNVVLFYIDNYGNVTAPNITLLQNEINDSTASNVDDVLVRRATMTHFEDIQIRRIECDDYIDLIDDESYFYWDDDTNNKIIRLGSSDRTSDPTGLTSGLDIHGNAEGSINLQVHPTEAKIVVRDLVSAPYLTAIDSNSQTVFQINSNGTITSDQIQNMVNLTLLNTTGVQDLGVEVSTNDTAITNLEVRVDSVETEADDNATSINLHSGYISNHTTDIHALEDILNEGPIELQTNGNANQLVRLNTLHTHPGLRIKCNKNAQVPYIMCESEAGEPRFSVEADGTILTHAIYDNNHQNLPDNLAHEIAVGGQSVYIGSGKVSYSDTDGFKFHKLKNNTVPTALAASPFNLTTADIDSGKNNNTVQRWLDLARPNHSHANLRIKDILPLSNQSADFDEVTIGGGGGGIDPTGGWTIITTVNASSNRYQLEAGKKYIWAYTGSTTSWALVPAPGQEVGAVVEIMSYGNSTFAVGSDPPNSYCGVIAGLIPTPQHTNCGISSYQIHSWFTLIQKKTSTVPDLWYWRAARNQNGP